MIPNFSGMLQMLMDTDLDTTQQDYVRTAQASGKALVSLINEVLDQAKIESGKLELEMVPFDLRTVCDDILSLFCGKAQEKGLEVINDYIYISMLSGTTLLLHFDRANFVFVFLLCRTIQWEQLAVYVSSRVPETLIGDPGRMRQIITNLVGNSIKVSHLLHMDSK
jgi:histidine kinase 2/3/4 (cytokinin receptor)